MNGLDQEDLPEAWNDDSDSGVVEISLKTGELNSLVLTTQVRVNWRAKIQAAQIIRDVTQVLLSATPVTELKGMDLDYFNEFYEVGLDAKNNFTWLPKFSVEVRQKQIDIKKKLEGRLTPNGPVPGPNPAPAAPDSGSKHPGS
jgi:hypothetical protein